MEIYHNLASAGMASNASPVLRSRHAMQLDVQTGLPHHLNFLLAVSYIASSMTVALRSARLRVHFSTRAPSKSLWLELQTFGHPHPN
jgi:hypothetical protein